MSSRAVAVGDQGSISSRIRPGGRSGPWAKRTSIRVVPKCGSRSTGPSQQAVAEAQFAAVSGELPAVKGGHVGVERDIRDSPERHQVRPLPGGGRPPLRFLVWSQLRSFVFLGRAERYGKRDCSSTSRRVA